MVRLLVASDTHGELDNVRKLVEKARQLRPDIVIHLGDDSPDAEPLRELGATLYVVPGVFEPHYKDPQTKRRLIVEVENLKILLSHTDTKHQNDPPEERDPQEVLNSGEIDMLLHGHTHIPKVEIRNRKVIVNPGHLKTSDKKGYPPTYAVIDIDREKVYVRIVELFTDKEVVRLEVSRDFIRPSA